MDYIGISCPVCGNKFDNDSDVVVCPECGAPHHRECWEKDGSCFFESMHGDGFAWKCNEEKAESAATDDDADKKAVNPTVCTECGYENPPYSIVCGNCAKPLNKNTEPLKEIDIYALLTDPLGGVPPEEEFDGIQAKKVADFIGSRSNYFMRVFYMLKKKTVSVVFNCFAFLCSGAWFVYKKMYLKGILIAMAMFAIDAFYYITDILVTLPYAAETQNMTYAQYMEFMLALPAQELYPLVIAYILNFVKFIAMLLIGFFANVVYKKHVIKKIKHIDNINDEKRKAEKTRKCGGTNIAAAIGVMILYYGLLSLVISYVLTLI